MLTRPVLLYDGNCGFCRTWINRLRRWDRAGRIDYVPCQQRAAVADLPAIGDDALEHAAHLVAPDGSVRAGARAMPMLLATCRAAACSGRSTTFRAADRLYAWVAMNRHRLGGSGSACGK